MARPVITLLTDFGLHDHFAGVMKGVILGICPDAAIVDITHDLPAQNVAEAAFVLACAYPYFPARTVHVAVVDPGVGGGRRPLAARCGEHLFVGPDNGIFSYVFADAEDWQAVAITNPECRLPKTSATFHGRDVFAPAAAHLAAGMGLEALGPVVTDPVPLDVPTPVETDAGLEAHVLHVDRFGNLVTDLTEERFAAWLGGNDAGGVVIQAGPASIEGIAECYDAVAEGRPLAIFGSAGRLEISVNRGSASELLRARRGNRVLLRRRR
ncbi:MAG: SAM-dependent chlorinase/fluorinase [Armatimonadota bacterium]|nr:MAG: SAM-dependent chlorinase/fluorinase [Armatimonadota bacterium]